ncbi:uncharacterized protein LOC107046929 [Diachasma alloeum]|uniref:uncharacterized protein LOC107046929 n=1 Tax=Diachasma alloeum TaxID=454923 RepID=UPI000738325B|nr:uncharacterized protein LOC107046929 [Diachasma alloeum]
MKRIILILIWCFCEYNNCIGYPEEEAVEYHGGAKGSSAPEITKLKIVRGTVKIEAENVWRVKVELEDESSLELKCRQTDGILINDDTPVWLAKRANRFDEIIYTRMDSVLRNLGPFKFCQNFDRKVAVTLFHDQKRAEIFIADVHGLNATRDLPDDSLYILNLLKELRSQKSIHDIEKDHLRSDPVPTTVYPQLLIQLEAGDARENLQLALMRMLSYWNAVDMLYSHFKQPRIKLNIAGLIVPADSFSAPWIAKAKQSDHHEHINDKRAIIELGEHFHRYAHIFSDDKHDFMISFISEQFDDDPSVLGISCVNSHCNSRKCRVAVIRNYLDLYLAGAHQLTHLLSAHSDDLLTDCKSKEIMSDLLGESSGKREWSSCSHDLLQNFFKKRRSECLDNCPRTNPDCGNNPKPVQIASTPKISCVRHPAEICKKTQWIMFSGHISCDRGITCHRSKKLDHMCAKPSLSRNKSKLCKTSSPKHIVPAEDGTLCGFPSNGPISACYAGECVPISSDIPRCPEGN